MPKKKAMLASTLVMLIIVLVIFVVLLRLDVAILSLFKTGADRSTCTWTAVMNSLTKTGGRENIAVVCPQKYVTIADTKRDLKDKKIKDEMERYLDIPLTKKEMENAVKWYNAYEEQIGSDKRYSSLRWKPEDSWGEKGEGFHRIYRLNEVLAKELKICWSQLGRGELDLFGQWFNIVAKEHDKSWFIAFFTPWESVELTANACIICSRVRFVISDKEVKEKLSQQAKEDTLADWLKKNPVMDFKSDRPLSYYEFLLDEGIESDFFRPAGDAVRFNIKNFDEEYAVVFVRERVVWPAEFAGIQALDSVLLIPYNEVKDRCEIMN